MPPPPRSPARTPLAGPFSRTVVLWLVLIAIFVALFKFFENPAAGGSDAPPSPELWGNVLGQLAPYLVFAGVFAVFYLWFRRFAVANKRAVDLMASGDAAAAVDVFRRLARTPLAPVGVARFNLGLALLRLGDLPGARDAFADAERSRAKALRPAIAGFAALCAAVAGELDAADRWIALARERAASPRSWSRIHLAAEAIVRLRRGDALGAARLFEEGWGELERCTSADLVRGLRVARALAAEQAGLGAGAAELLAGARPFRPGEYAWIAAGWPELARYLAEKGFDAAA